MNKNKAMNAIALGVALLGATTGINAMEKAEKNRDLAEVTMVVPVQAVIENIKEKKGFIATFTPIDSLVDVKTSKVFDSKSHNLKVKTLKSVIDHIDKTYLYQSNVSHTEVKSYPKFSKLDKNYLLNASFTNGDKLIYTIIAERDIEKAKLDDFALNRLFMTEGVAGSFSHINKTPGSYNVTKMDTVNIVNGYELIDFVADNKEYRVVFKNEKNGDDRILYAMIKQK